MYHCHCHTSVFFPLFNCRKKDEELKQLDQAYAEKLHDQNNLMQQQKLIEEEMNNTDNEIDQFKIKINQLRLKLLEEKNNYEEPKDIDCLVSFLFFFP